jgi:hypothetical protein
MPTHYMFFGYEEENNIYIYKFFFVISRQSLLLIEQDVH